MNTAIRFDGLTKAYGERRGVFDLRLDVAAGEIFGFLGPNGAGKSTAIRLLLNLIRPDAGNVDVFGHDCRRESVAVHRLVGYLPGEFALDAKLTGRQLLTYLANLRGGVDWQHVDSLAHKLELNLDLPFGDYSRGNKQKVGLLQAFMHRPPLLILDEPTGGLDPLNQEAVLELVRDAHAGGATVFFSSHILGEVEQVCHSVGFIREGRLIRVGPVHEVLGVRSHAIEAECTSAPDQVVLAAATGVRNVRVEGNTASFVVDGEMGDAMAALSRFGVRELLSREPSLADVFLSLYETEPDPLLRPVFTKSLRDQRWPILAWGLSLALLSIINSVAYTHAYPDLNSRLKLAAQLQTSLSFASLIYGEPHHIETLRGWVEWRSLAATSLLFGIFTVLAASSATRGAEESGVIEVVVSGPLTRRRVFMEQALAVAVTLAAACLIVWVALVIIGPLAGEPGLPAGDALLAVANIFDVGLLAAALALLAGQFTASRRGAGFIAGGVFTALYIWDNLGLITTSLAGWRWLSPLHLASRSSPLATGHFDLVAFAGLAAISCLLVALACWLTARRDLFGVFVLWRRPEPRLAAAEPTGPAAGGLGLRSPFWHGVAQARGTIVGWGISLGLLVILLTGATPGIRAAWADAAGAAVNRLPNGQITDTAVMSFIVFDTLPLFLAALALTQAAAWASEELEGRLEVYLSAPLARGSFYLQKAGAAIACVALVTAVVAVCVLAAAAGFGIDLSWWKALLALALLLPVAAVVVAFAFLIASMRPSLVIGISAPTLLVSYLLDLLVPLFGWPDYLRDASIFHLYGSPLLDGPNWPTTAAMLLASAAFLAAGSVLFARRDITR